VTTFPHSPSLDRSRCLPARSREVAHSLPRDRVCVARRLLPGDRRQRRRFEPEETTRASEIGPAAEVGRGGVRSSPARPRGPAVPARACPGHQRMSLDRSAASSSSSRASHQQQPTHTVNTAMKGTTTRRGHREIPAAMASTPPTTNQHLTTGASSSSSRRSHRPSALTADEEMVLAHAGNLDFASSLHDDEDDVNLYIIAEMLREKKRKTDRNAEVSYREPFESNNSSPSSCTDSIQSRLKARNSRKEASASSAASSAAFDLSRSRSSEFSRTTSSVNSSLQLPSRSGPLLSTTQLKNRAHRSSYSSISGAAAVAATVAAAIAAPPQTTLNMAVSPSSAPMSGPTSSTTSPTGTSMQARKRQRDQSRMAQASDMALSSELEKMVMEVSKPAAQGVSIDDTTFDTTHVAVDAADAEMVSEGSDEMQVKFHDCEQQTPEPPNVPAMDLSASAPSSSFSYAQDWVMATSIHLPATFHSVASSPRPFSGLLSFLDLAGKAIAMGVSKRFQEVMLLPPGSQEAAGLWQGSVWSIGGPSPLLTAKYLMKVNATYGVQEVHKDWIIAANPPSSFLLSRLEHLSLAQDENSSLGGASSSSSSSSSSALSDFHFVLLPYFSSLRTLDFSHISSMSPRLTATTLARVSLLPALETLILDHCSSWVDDLALASLRQKDHAAQSALPMSQWRFLPPVSNLPQLRKLSLEFCTRLTPRAIEYLVGAGGLPQLTELNLANCTSIVSTESMAALRWNTPLLRKLNLNWTVPSSCDAGSLLRPVFSMPSLSELELRGWTCLRDQSLSGVFAQGASAMTMNRPLLRSLSLRECGSGMSESGLAQSLVAMGEGLRELELSDCRGVTDSVLAAIGARLSQLHAFTLWNAPVKVTDQGVEALLFGGATVQAFFSAPVSAQVVGLYRTLHTLRLSSSPSLGQHGCSVLARCQALTFLELSDSSQIDDAAIESLVDSARVGGYLSFTLKTLLLPRLGSGFTSASGAALAQLGELREVDLSYNDGIDDAFVMTMLPGTPKMQKLHLSQCPISCASLAALSTHAFAVAQSGSNIHLDVKYCPHISPKSVARLKATHPRIDVSENLAEYIQTALPAQPAGVLATPRRRSSISKRDSSSGGLNTSPSATDGGFRIENQLVEDDSNEGDDAEDGEDDAEQGEDEEDCSSSSEEDDSMSVDDIQFHEENCEETQAGEVWAVHA
jgi:hypothetical protein